MGAGCPPLSLFVLPQCVCGWGLSEWWMANLLSRTELLIKPEGEWMWVDGGVGMENDGGAGKWCGGEK